MLGSYLTAAVRYVSYNKFASSISVLSLAVGLTAALLVLLFVHHELSYDDWIPDAERIYRYETEITELDGSSQHLALSPAVTSAALSGRFSEIEAAIRILPALHSLHVENKVYYEWITFAEEDFFGVLDIPLLKGNKETALTGTTSILVSEEMAQKYFGSQSPLGQTLSVEEGNGGEIRDFKVTGVFRDIPMNSHLDFNFIAAKQPNEEDFDSNLNDSWHDFGVYTYLKLAKGTGPELLEASFPALLDDQVDRARWDGDYSGSDFYQPYLINLTDIHMDTRTADPMRPVGDRELIYVLLGIALLILAIASINFMNLALARSMSRAREVSIRKIHGASRRQLIHQYLGETVILTLLALGLAMIMTSYILPYLNAFVGKDMTLSTLLNWDMVLTALTLLLFVAGLAGFYPAFVLSQVKPASNLGGMAGKRASGARLRTALVVFQFTVSIALGIAAVVIQSQRHYTATHDLGFSTGDKLVIRWMNWGHFADKSEIIKERIGALGEVVGTAYSSFVPGDRWNGSVGMSAPGYTGDASVRARPLNVDDGFFDVYGVDLIAGRFFSREFGEDYLVSSQPGEKTIRAFPAILSESAVKGLGFESAEAAIGATLDVGNDTLEPRVVGVVSDFHFSSLREPVLPVTYYMSKEEFSTLTVSFQQGTNIETLVQDIKTVWHEFIRDPITLEYLDQNVAAHYAEDRRQGVMVTSLAALALFVACMGLYGLSALTAAEWSREVSIRKVHGASIPVVTWLLLWRFSVPVLLAILFAWPLAWFGARQYLNQFSYRVDLGPGFFLVAGLAALLIAGLTVAGHAFKVARTNPILALEERA